MAMYPVDSVISGQALETDGFIGFNTISGLGLVTFGFLWPCTDIWVPSDSAIRTTWAPASLPANTVEVCKDDEGGIYA